MGEHDGKYTTMPRLHSSQRTVRERPNKLLWPWQYSAATCGARKRWQSLCVLQRRLLRNVVPTLFLACVMSFAGDEAVAVYSPQTSIDVDPLSYDLGPGDEIHIWAFGLEEIGKESYRIDSSGLLDIPHLGQIHASGQTLDMLRDQVETRLRKYVREPAVTVNLVARKSNPVSVLGCVNKPGVYRMESPRPLLEVLSMAGGLRDDAGYSVHVSRRNIWRNVLSDGGAVESKRTVETSEIDLKPLLSGERQGSDVVIYPDSVVTVQRAGMTFVIGAVNKPGSIVLNDASSVSVLEALSVAGGFAPLAAPASGRILRFEEGSVRSQIPVNLKDVLSGKSEDVSMYSGDVLYVPPSTAKQIGKAALHTSLSILAGVIIWRR